jgi:hypothetical protein
MEGTYDIHTIPADVSGEPIGTVTADSRRNARRKVARIMKLGYEIRVVRSLAP